jgi:hypothetical protein
LASHLVRLVEASGHFDVISLSPSVPQPVSRDEEV